MGTEKCLVWMYNSSSKPLPFPLSHYPVAPLASTLGQHSTYPRPSAWPSRVEDDHLNLRVHLAHCLWIAWNMVIWEMCFHHPLVSHMFGFPALSLGLWATRTQGRGTYSVNNLTYLVNPTTGPIMILLSLMSHLVTWELTVITNHTHLHLVPTL